MTPRLVLIGPPGSGKSTVAHSLAKKLHLEHVDSDTLLAQTYGMPCSEVYTFLGEQDFRKVEQHHVEQALRSDGIVSLGGGAVLNQQTQAALAELPVVYLEVSVDEGVERTQRDDSRPILRGENPRHRYAQILEQREPIYKELATKTVHSSSSSPQIIVNELIDWLEE